MTTELVPLGPDGPADVAPTGPPEPPPGVDLVALVLVGLAEQSVAGYRKDFDAFGRFLGLPAAAALWRLLCLPGPAANALCLAYRDVMDGRGLAAATVARRLAALKRAARRARMVGLTSLVLEVDRPRAEAFRDCSGPGAAGWARMLEAAELRAAGGSALGARDVAILRLLHDRALRRGEVVGLDWPAHVDPDRPAVSVRGKGQTSREWLTISPEARDALNRWVALRGDWPGSLFVRIDPAAAGSRERLTGNSVNRLVGALARRAGLPRAVRAHGLRHSAITEALNLGHDVRDVRHFSRHAKIDTVLIYDDRRKDVGGEITRALSRGRRKRK